MVFLVHPQIRTPTQMETSYLSVSLSDIMLLFLQVGYAIVQVGEPLVSKRAL